LAGNGRHRGAPSVVREYELLAPARVDFRLVRMQYPPAGLRGGGPGTTSRLRIRQSGEWRDLSGKGTVALSAGDRVSVELAGGGGYGETGAADPSAPAGG
jgi:N-methylhydantoinase B/oxoprolinase/acetone carboxylase alpha subunit